MIDNCYIYHGTKLKNIKKIREEGLKILPIKERTFKEPDDKIFFSNR